jgi:bifunctional N-acetylglucosamine-1-phosphate-uridyltransferase/glucosamine-1-phosphate-acetyltransferase GlmU-like protein
MGYMEKFILETDILTEFEFEKPKDCKVRAVVLVQDSHKELCKQDMLGRSVFDWVACAVDDYKWAKVDIAEGQSVAEVVAPFAKDEDFLLVVFADTPLVSRHDFADALDYAITKNLDFCKLPRGFVFKVSALKSGHFELSGEANFLSKEDFFSVFDESTLAHARRVMKERILQKHLKNGVNFYDLASSYVECFVKIGKRVSVLPGNVLKGETTIGSGTILGENNVIEDCEIGENCNIISSVLTGVKIENNSKLGPFLVKGKEKK